jgi:hypothetical protein
VAFVENDNVQFHPLDLQNQASALRETAGESEKNEPSPRGLIHFSLSIDGLSRGYPALNRT